MGMGKCLNLSHRSPFAATLLLSVLLGNSPILFAQLNTSKRGLTSTDSQSAISAQKRGGYYALVIGINNYQHLAKLKTALGDSEEIAKILREQYEFKTQLLTDATRDQILLALDDYRHRLGNDDNLLIYYAGHGYHDDQSDQAYWAPVDAEPETYRHWIIASEITGTARAIPARHVLIVSDSCYSGMLTRDVSPVVITPIQRDLYLGKMLESRSRHVMSSGGNEPVADSDVAGHSPNHSVFANALLQGLNQTSLPEFSAEELFNNYVKEQVGGRSDQVPEYNPIRNSGHDRGDFVFFRSGIAAANLSAIGSGKQSSGSEMETKSAAKMGSSSAAGTIDMSGIGNLLNKWINMPVALIHTTAGDMHCDLYEVQTPLAVANFIGLARGTKDWKDPVTHITRKDVPLYNGTIFHRVVPNFMIQGGDPAGTGQGDPGYSFPDEIRKFTFDSPGLLGMANAGPDTNGSQFFITEVPTPQLNGRFTIFGQCDAATVELVKKITRMPRDRNDRPIDPVKITYIEILRRSGN